MLQLIYAYLAAFPEDKSLTIPELVAKIAVHQAQLGVQPAAVDNVKHKASLTRERDEWIAVASDPRLLAGTINGMDRKKYAEKMVTELDKKIATL